MATMANNHRWTNLAPRLKRYLEWRYPGLKRAHAGIVAAVVLRGCCWFRAAHRRICVRVFTIT
jgi:hypothetical protein